MILILVGLTGLKYYARRHLKTNAVTFEPVEQVNSLPDMPSMKQAMIDGVLKDMSK